MSTTRPSALDLAIEQAADKHLEHEKALGQARSRLQSAETTYNTLSAFCGEYAGRLRGVTQLNKETLTNYHRFLGKLDHALANQKNDVDQAGLAVTQRQEAWFESLRRLKGMELLRTRRATAVLNQQKRQEQKQSDEFAARSARRLTHHA